MEVVYITIFIGVVGLIAIIVTAYTHPKGE